MQVALKVGMLFRLALGVGDMEPAIQVIVLRLARVAMAKDPTQLFERAGEPVFGPPDDRIGKVGHRDQHIGLKADRLGKFRDIKQHPVGQGLLERVSDIQRQGHGHSLKRLQPPPGPYRALWGQGRGVGEWRREAGRSRAGGARFLSADHATARRMIVRPDSGDVELQTAGRP